MPYVWAARRESGPRPVFGRSGPTRAKASAATVREAAEELEAAQVEAARKAGATWIEIGACYGLTKQGAQQRFRAARNQAKAVTAAPTSKKAEPVA